MDFIFDANDLILKLSHKILVLANSQLQSTTLNMNF